MYRRWFKYEAVHDLCCDMKAAEASRDAMCGDPRDFHIHYKSAKDPEQSVTITNCSNYSLILVPNIGFIFYGQPVIKVRNKNNRTAQNMYTWSHHAFRQRLEQKAEETGCQIIYVDEDDSTQMCGYCGVRTRR